MATPLQSMAGSMAPAAHAEIVLLKDGMQAGVPLLRGPADRQGQRDEIVWADALRIAESATETVEVLEDGDFAAIHIHRRPHRRGAPCSSRRWSKLPAAASSANLNARARLASTASSLRAPDSVTSAELEPGESVR